MNSLQPQYIIASITGLTPAGSPCTVVCGAPDLQPCRQLCEFRCPFNGWTSLPVRCVQHSDKPAM